jgi:serine phosphatase RsbU (regulator of sigma subunit)
LPFPNWPPGIPPRHADVEGANLRAGLYIPLVAQEALVGLMVVHSTRKPAFTPGEVALIQTFANQAALAIQRTGLVEQLRAKIEALEAAQAELVQKERLERELELARQVQQSLLPRDFPQVSGFQFAARYEPARQVGGDLYDVIPLDGERFGVAIADVSDKGMPAALYMALTRSLMLAEARRETSPGEVLRRINRLLLELSQPGMFVTVFYAVVDRSAGLLTYASAGHERPLLLRGGELRELEGAGNPLGILPEEEFEIHEGIVALQADDRLVLYTDGLADVVSRDGQLFDRARLKAIVQAHAGLLPADLCEAVFAALLAYQGGGEQFDDMAMLVMRVVPVDQR